MNEFDIKAASWDQDPMKLKRSEAVAKGIEKIIPLSDDMITLEFGSGTGLISFYLKDKVKEITLMDSSAEMVRIAKKKIIDSDAGNLKTILFDLEKEDWKGGKFDIILTQMVLHHISDYKGIIKKFYQMLNPGGYIAIADLYSEDGSFHGDGFSGHKGFDPEKLSAEIRKNKFTDLFYEKCFTIMKQISVLEKKQYDLFLMIAKKLNK